MRILVRDSLPRRASSAARQRGSNWNSREEDYSGDESRHASRPRQQLRSSSFGARPATASHARGQAGARPGLGGGRGRVSEGREETGGCGDGGVSVMAETVFLDNVAYALRSRLAFSPYLAGSSAEDTLAYGGHERQPPASELQSARSALQRAALGRLRELQLLAEWPLMRPRRTPQQMERLLAGGARASELVSSRSGPAMDLALPRLPAALLTHGSGASGPGGGAGGGVCLLGPTDVALALAGQHGKDALPLGSTLRGPGPAGFGSAAHGVGGMMTAVLAATCTAPTSSSSSSSVPYGAGVAADGPSLPALAAVPPLFPPTASTETACAGSAAGHNGSSHAHTSSSTALAASCLAGLRDFFHDLRPEQRHVGVDDRCYPWFRDVKLCAARALLAEGSARSCARFAVFGAPHGVRAALWETALGLRPQDRTATVTGVVPAALTPAAAAAASSSGKGGRGSADEATEYFERLCEQVLSQPMLVDLLVVEDAAALAGNAEAFFLFEEDIRALLLAFLRDAAVGPRLAAAPFAPLHASSAVQAAVVPSPPKPTSTRPSSGPGQQQGEPNSARDAGGGGGGAAGAVQRYPPCGVLPFRGLALLAAPLFYLYDNPASAYRLFRSMYCRFWVKLHSLQSCGMPSPALPELLQTLELLLQALDPELWHHLRHRLGVRPAALALPWITTAFAGALPLQEVMLLWDRVIGLDSLLPLPLLAAAILRFRRHVLLSCRCPAEVAAALRDLSQLQAVPLMQALLFAGHRQPQEQHGQRDQEPGLSHEQQRTQHEGHEWYGAASERLSPPPQQPQQQQEAHGRPPPPPPPKPQLT